MEILNLITTIGTYGIMAFVLIAAVAVVTLRSLFHSALCLAAVLIGMAFIYIGFRADFLAAIQILIYVGAVMTLIIFAIMLTEQIGAKTIRQTNHQSLAATLGLLALVALVGKILLKTPWPVTKAALESKVTVLELGNALMGSYVFPFEVISVVLVAALIGAIVIAKKDPEERS